MVGFPSTTSWRFLGGRPIRARGGQWGIQPKALRLSCCRSMAGAILNSAKPDYLQSVIMQRNCINNLKNLDIIETVPNFYNNVPGQKESELGIKSLEVFFVPSKDLYPGRARGDRVATFIGAVTSEDTANVHFDMAVTHLPISPKSLILVCQHHQYRLHSFNNFFTTPTTSPSSHELDFRVGGHPSIRYDRYDG